jgi:hypothetical protein
MDQSASKKPSFIKRNRFLIESIALVLLLVLPFGIYIAVRAGATELMDILLAFFTLVIIILLLVGKKG